MSYLIYLRKSRADLEAEARGEGETLARHKTALLELAKRMGLEVGGIYEEVVSGETIAARPQMQRLLGEVEAGEWSGVLVMEVERLARGDSIDQGIVSQAFKYSGTKIITPAKTYDPTNEFDEEYFEFGLFMSRREYKTIKRRMIAGRIASVKEGKYMGKTDPYGYYRVKLDHDKGYTLKINPEQAAVVRDIYQMRLDGIGCYAIARKLTMRGERTTAGIAWSGQSVSNVLRNPLYAGYVTWGRKAAQPTVKDGVLKKPRRIVEDYVKAKGLHEPIVSEQDFERVQQLVKEAPAFPVKKGVELTNPFVGLLYCRKCGHVLTQTVSRGKPRFWCTWVACDNVGASREDIEEALMHTLTLWLSEYDLDVAEQNSLNANFESRIQREKAEMYSIQQEQKKQEAQLERASELVEQGVYTPEHFVSRQKQISQRMSELEALRKSAEKRCIELEKERAASSYMAPKIRHVLEAYPTAQTAKEKNDLLRTILSRIDYQKTGIKNGRGDSHITLKLSRKFDT